MSYVHCNSHLVFCMEWMDNMMVMIIAVPKLLLTLSQSVSEWGTEKKDKANIWL